MSIYKKYCKETFDEEGKLKKFELNYPNNFNFGYDVVDEIAKVSPNKRALVWCNTNNEERVFSFADIKRYSNKVANVFLNAGLKRGDRVMVILKRHYEYWFVAVALHKLGITLIPATHMLTVDDLVYRIQSSGCTGIVCSPYSEVPEKVSEAVKLANHECKLWTVQESVNGFMNLNEQMFRCSDELPRQQTCVTDPMLIYYTSGTTGHPKGVIHDFLYPLAHIMTSKYWHQAKDNGLHLTIAEIGWSKASWGKIYGQWLVGTAVMVCDFDNFDPKYIAHIINKYGVTTFCAPPTFFRYFVLIKDIPAMPTLRHVSTGGESLSPDVFKKFHEKTGHVLHEGYGQSETTMLIGNIKGYDYVEGSLGIASPQYNVKLIGKDGEPVKVGEIGEICVVPSSDGVLPGIVRGYVGNDEQYRAVWRGGVYHTGDSAWQDENGRFWFNGRFDDIIKTGGFRVGPCEIENVLMQHNEVVECCVIGVPDTLRGQAIKAYVILDENIESTKQKEREIKEFCNSQLAEYKWIRMVEFVKVLPKTTSGKIRKTELRTQA
ncbi:MAG: AMP-binding protein [Clostridia bacterium]|nr:AMP-binding protein [Clostridia bacterium]